MQKSWSQFFDNQLENLRQQQTLRTRGGTDQLSSVTDKRLLDFSSNDYLGLRRNPLLLDSLFKATKRQGWGSGASPVLSGYHTEHQELESSLAHLSNTEDCLVFSSGFACNVGVISCLLDDETLVLSDQLNHASLIDGMRIGKHGKLIYQHCDMRDLSNKLELQRSAFGRCLIVTESVFSMDGDEAPLQELVSISRRFDCGLIVDEAHAVGVFGERGGGLLEELQLSSEVLIKLGTLSKALGGIGGYAAGSKKVVEYLISRCRSYLFSTAPPAGAMAASRIAVELCCQMSSEREHLLDLAKAARRQLRELGWQVASGRSPIIPIIVGSPECALELSNKLRVSGLLVPAIRPPTVPHDTCRLRVSLSARHSQADIERLCSILGNCGR